MDDHGVDFTTFEPLINDVFKYVENIGKSYQNAEHNKRICRVLLQRAVTIEASVKSLKLLKNDRKQFFEDRRNYTIFQAFSKNLQNIDGFIEDVSQLEGLSKYANQYAEPDSLQRKFRHLTEEFDKNVKALGFHKEMLIPEEEDNQSLQMDLDEMSEYMKNIEGGITEGGVISEGVEKVAAMHKTFQKKEFLFSGLDDSKLEANNFEDTDTKYAKLRKCIRRSDYCAVTFKEIEFQDKETEENLKREVTILKQLKGAENIMVFYGIVYDTAKTYLVTEWAEHDNLKEYYTKNKMQWPLKCQFAVDISRGLTYLNGTQILHHDIRSENIFITNANITNVNRRHIAKIGNFSLSRGLAAATTNIRVGVDNVRYMAPEKLKDHRHPYDFKCEIYSFGMLLWEIAEEKSPYTDIDSDIVKIREQVLDGYREAFNPGKNVPLEWQNVVDGAREADASMRPTLVSMFTVLFDLAKRHRAGQEAHGFSFAEHRESRFGRKLQLQMSVQAAIKEHKKKGDRRKAYDSFSWHADLGDFVARYWKGYYLYYNVLGWPEGDDARASRLKQAAELFKETADRDMHEAQLRYGHCLWKGEGVQKDTTKAVDYFLKAANNGNATAMYNVGNMFYNGIGVSQDRKKGTHYILKAAYNGQPKALDMCKKYDIPLYS